MKYTYQIKFGDEDYVDLYLYDTNLEGDWVQDTMIWREKLSECKISGALNNVVDDGIGDTIYNTLETWFEDSTKFATQIFIKVLKNNVQDSVHWFGIKWGKLNKELKTYIVTPELYDYWGQYFESIRDIRFASSVSGSPIPSYYNTGTTYPYINRIAIGAEDLESVVKDVATFNNAWPSSDIVSSFLWQDNDEEDDSINTFQGMPGDYVTGVESYLKRAGIYVGNSITFSDVLKWLLLFRCYAFFDSNNKLRFEHMSYFNTKLANNAVNFSAYLNDYDDEFEYDNYNIPTLEKLSMQSNEVDDADFAPVNIIYSQIRHRPDIQTIEHSFDLYSNMSLLDAPIDDVSTLYGALANHTYTFFDIDLTTFSNTKNLLDITWNVGAGEVNCGSNDFRIYDGDDYTFTAVLSVLTGQFKVGLYDRSGDTLISNEITVSSTGTTSDTLTATADSNDGFLKVTATVSNTGAATGYITLIDTDTRMIVIPTNDGANSGSPKTNGAMSAANIFDSYWQDDRLAFTATANDKSYDFDNTLYNLRRKTVKFHYSGVINPLFGFNDGTRIGKIEKLKRSLDTDFYEIDVIYREDE